jgi:N-acetylmuramoyl-L-alanine amidase
VDVDNRGRITAKGLGFTIIEVSSEEKPNLKIDYRVQVIRNLKIYLSPENITTKVSPFDFYGRERDRMEEFAHHLHNYLKDNSCDVIVGDLTIGGNDRDIIERINQSNDLGADLHIALHSNGGGGFGPEIWYAEQDDTTRSEESLKLSNSIYNNLFSLYEKDFGTTIKRYGTGVVEYGTGGIRFAELRTPNLPIGSNLTAGPEAIPSYIEVAFHDTERDARWIINNMKSIAAVIGNGLLNYM